MKPAPSAPPWEDAQFISLHMPLPTLGFIQDGWKEMAHSHILVEKEKISEFSSLDEWELRKKITNPYEAIFSGSEDSSFPSLAKVHPLSRSYFKMIEMLHVCKFWSTISPTKPFVSAHICEGPGGFLQNIVEQAKVIKLPVKALYAMTLKPTKSHIPGWRRSIGFLRKHPQIQLEYGADDTGNILLQANQKAFCDRVGCQAQIFTADGGFDFSVDYSKQEESAFSLLLASFTIGLKCLAKGGTMIIKLFDIYSDVTQDLFLGSAVFFKSFTLYKPATSRPCNSERYFIAQGFIGTEAAVKWIQHLEHGQVAHQITPLTRLFNDDWPSPVKSAVLEQIRWQEKLQMDAIHNTLTFVKDTTLERIQKNIETSTNWCKVFNVRY
jgi:cap2 methyltransferase